MPREIKTTIAVDGEQAFKRAINDANTSLRNMGTQLTLASAQFKKDGDAMKLMETRSKALRGEIGQQEEIVKALEKAVTDSTKAYGENTLSRTSCNQYKHSYNPCEPVHPCPYYYSIPQQPLVRAR